MRTGFKSSKRWAFMFESDDTCQASEKCEGAVDASGTIIEEEANLAQQAQSIDNDIATIEEDLEAVEEVQEQINQNKDLLDNTPEAITPEVVTESNKVLVYGLAKLGKNVKALKDIKIGVESVSMPIQNLQVCQEGLVQNVKDFFAKIWEFLKKVGRSIVDFFKRLFGFTAKKEKKVAELADAVGPKLKETVNAMAKDVNGISELKAKANEANELREEIKDRLQKLKEENNNNISPQTLKAVTSIVNDVTLCNAMEFIYKVSGKYGLKDDLLKFATEFPEHILEVTKNPLDSKGPKTVILKNTTQIDKEMIKNAGSFLQVQNPREDAIFISLTLTGGDPKGTYVIANDEGSFEEREVFFREDKSQTFQFMLEKGFFDYSYLSDWIKNAKQEWYSGAIKEIESKITQVISENEKLLKATESKREIPDDDIGRIKATNLLLRWALQRTKFAITILSKLPDGARYVLEAARTGN